MADIEDEPLFAMSETDLALLKAEKNLVTFALTSHVRDEIRAECLEEMIEAKKRGWRLRP